MFQGAEDHEFAAGMKLESVNPHQRGQICVATIAGVFDSRLLQLRLDHQVASSPFYCAVDSHDVFPIGWCESNQYQLKTPLMKSVPPPPPLPPPAQTEKSSASRKVAVVQPE